MQKKISDEDSTQALCEHCKCRSILLDVNPFPNDKFQTLPKLKEVADDNFQFDENVRKFSKWVENTVGKGEIARNEQFLLFPQCFQWICTADT